MTASASTNYLRPVLFLILVGSVAWAIVQLAQLIFPGSVDSFVIVLCLVAALEGMYSGHLARAQNLRGGDVTKFHAVELIGLFLLLKVLNDFGPLPEMAARLLTLDPKTVVEAILLLAFWVTGLDTGQDFTELDAPPIIAGTRAGNVSPTQRLYQRFFSGGVVLLAVTGLSNVRSAAPGGLVLNLLTYFVTGLLFLSQTRLAAARKEWLSLGLTSSSEVSSRWLRFSAILIGLAALIAFVLPTQYMRGLLDLLRDLMNVIMAIALTIGSLIAWIVSVPVRLLMGQPVDAPPNLMQSPPQQTPPQTAAADSPLWSLLPKLLLLVIMAYIIVSYLRDNPEILAMLRKLRIVHFLRELWAFLRKRAGNFGILFRVQLPKSLPTWRRRAVFPSAQRFGFIRLNSLAPRERILYFYLSTVRRARERGIPRTPDQTPYEYEEVLSHELEDSKVDVDALTEAFVEARYSPAPVNLEKVQYTQTHWQRLRYALQRIKRQNQDANDNG